MRGVQNAIVSASLATVALAHGQHAKRGAVPADGSIITHCVETGVVALTFDDGPWSYTQDIVDKLTTAGHRVTFFQNGQNWGNIYDFNSTLQSMIAGGHQIASHTWSHADLATLTEDQIVSEMGTLETAHLAIIGKAPTYMRPPYLSTNDLALSTLAGLGYKIIEVDVDTQDWAEGPAGTIQNSIDWYEGNFTDGCISLNHDPYQPTADTFVPAIIEWLATKSLKSVPVGECLGDDPANWYRGAPAVSSSVSATVSGTASGTASVPYSTLSVVNGTGHLPPPPPATVTKSYGTGSMTRGGAGHLPTVSVSPHKGGDSEPGHGPGAGRGALPGHSGEGDWGYTPNCTESATGTWAPGSPGSYPTGSAWKNATATGPSGSYYSNAASSLSGGAAVVGAAFLALFL